jgi:hypothetical protein
MRNGIGEAPRNSKKLYTPPVLTRYGDICEITATVGISGHPDNVTGLTRTSLEPLNRRPPQVPPH